MGDPGGIGPEVTLKALLSRPVRSLMRRRSDPVQFIVIGSPEVYLENQKIIRSDLSFNIVHCVDDAVLKRRSVNILDLQDEPGEVQIGKISIANAVLSFHALEVGAYLAREGIIDALVTASINKKSVQLISPGFTGHTEYLARMSKTKEYAMMLTGGPLRVVLVTTHLPLSQVSARISRSAVYSKISIAHTFLKKRLGVRRPKIGVAALNPHAGEGGKMGDEKKDKITPAIKRAAAEGIRVSGPVPSDIIFYEACNNYYDAVIALYHDQGLGPLKMIAFHTGVNVTLNLPFIRTSPDHGTAFDIAYKNKAHPGSMTEAIKMAAELI